MIKNDTELEISIESLVQLRSSLQNIYSDELFKGLSLSKQEIYKTALQGEIDNLNNQITEYEGLKTGDLKSYISKNFTELPLNLIRARIAKGFDEQFVANELNIEVSEYIELEDELFSEANPVLIGKLIDLVGGLEIPLELKTMFNSSSKVIIKNIEKSTKSLSHKLIPFELREGYDLINGYLKLFSSLKKIFKDNLDEIVSGSKINHRTATSVRYKIPKGTKGDLVYLYTSYAEFIAKEISIVLKPSNKKLTTDPIEFRKNVIKEYGILNLESCVSYMWDLGIPVIPLEMPGGFHGACWRFNGRNVIVLKQQDKSYSRWLFDLLHEYWHATQEPKLLEREVIDLSEGLSGKLTDQEEIDANKFAEDVIFEGKGEELFDECFHLSRGRIPLLKSKTQQVAFENHVDIASLANFVAYKVSLLGYSWWGAARNLQELGNPYHKTYEIMNNRLDFSLFYLLEDPFEQELIERVLCH